MDSDGLERRARLAFQSQRTSEQTGWDGPKRPLGEVLEEGGNRYATAQVTRHYQGIPGELRAPVAAHLSPVEHAKLTMLEIAYHPPESDCMRYLYVTEEVARNLLDLDFGRTESPLFMRFSQEDGRLDLTQEGFEFAMQHYAVRFVDDAVFGEVAFIDGTPFRPTAVEPSPWRMASAALPRSTTLAINAGFENGLYATDGRPEAIDRVLTGRFEPTPLELRTADPAALYPSQKLGFKH